MLYPGICSHSYQHEEYRAVIVERVHVYKAARIKRKPKSHSDSTEKENQGGYEYAPGKPQVSVVMYLRNVGVTEMADGQRYVQEKYHSHYLVIFKPYTAVL